MSEFCTNNGYNPKYAIRLLNGPPPEKRRIFRVLFFYQPGRLIVVTSGFQKLTQQTPPADVARADRLRALWLKYRNQYPESEKTRQAILREAGL